jgi:hypothetical protein
LKRRSLHWALCCLLLVSCGGGGGGDDTQDRDSGNGSAALVPPGTRSFPLEVRTIGLIAASHFVDVNQDGFPDLIVSGEGDANGGRDYLLLNDGSGRFSLSPAPLPPRYLGRNGRTVAIADGDFNADGRPDLILVTVDDRPGSYYSSARVHLYLNDGQGRFSDASDRISGGTIGNGWPEWVRVGDFDGDGRADFMLTSPGNAIQSCSVLGGRIFLNSAEGLFSQARITMTDRWGSYEDDCLTYDRAANVNGGRGVFTGYTLDALVGDFNSDGLPDIVSGTLQTVWPAFINRSSPGSLRFDVVFNGVGLEADPPDPFDDQRAGVVWKNGTLADIDGDGKADLVVANPIAGLKEWRFPVQIWRGLGEGRFSFAGGAGSDTCMLDQPGGCQAFRVADHPTRTGVLHARQWLSLDINRDGFQDVFIADHGLDFRPFAGGRNILLLGQADGRMTDASASWLSNRDGYTHGAAIGDVNGNGYPDIFKNNTWQSNGPTPSYQAPNLPRLYLNPGGAPLVAAE